MLWLWWVDKWSREFSLLWFWGTHEWSWQISLLWFRWTHKWRWQIHLLWFGSLLLSLRCLLFLLLLFKFNLLDSLLHDSSLGFLLLGLLFLSSLCFKSFNFLLLSLYSLCRGDSLLFLGNWWCINERSWSNTRVELRILVSLDSIKSFLEWIDRFEEFILGLTFLLDFFKSRRNSIFWCSLGYRLYSWFTLWLSLRCFDDKCPRQLWLLIVIIN